MEAVEIYQHIFKKALYTKIETSMLLSKSIRKIDYLIADGELIAHAEKMKTKGVTVTTESIIKYIEKHKIPPEAHQE